MIMNNKISFRFSAFSDEIASDFDEQLSALQKLGIHMLELRGVNGKSFTELTDDEVIRVRDKMRAANIGLSALGSPIGKIAVDGDFEGHKKLFSRIMDIGDMLDCKRIRMFSFYPGETSPDEFEARVFAYLEELLQMAEERGFVLCHENEKDIYGETPEQARKLMDRFSGRLRTVLDPGNFAFCLLDAQKGYDLLKPYITYMHIKDADEEGTIVPPGTGVAHIRDILQAWAAENENGEIILTIEPHLTVFSGLSSLSKLDDIKHKYVFHSAYEAFETAYRSVRKMAEEIGTIL